jgi:hypothetical protein
MFFGEPFRFPSIAPMLSSRWVERGGVEGKPATTDVQAERSPPFIVHTQSPTPACAHPKP